MVGFELGVAVGFGVDVAVGFELGVVVGFGVGVAVGFELGVAVSSEVSSELGSAVDSGIGVAVGSEPGAAVDSGVGFVVGSEVAAGSDVASGCSCFSCTFIAVFGPSDAPGIDPHPAATMARIEITANASILLFLFIVPDILPINPTASQGISISQLSLFQAHFTPPLKNLSILSYTSIIQKVYHFKITHILFKI